ncbi:MAG: S8 family serine peptidase, partial [Paracoccaceae bacterium]|nr:S8 family serine peptidase [Paracoccaceae bacterium]
MSLRSQTIDLKSVERVERLDAPGWLIVQFNEPVTSADKARLSRAYGLSFDNYVAQNGFLEKVAPEALAQLNSDPAVGAVVRYGPELKIDPELGQKKFTSEERAAEPGLVLMVMAFENTSADAFVEELKERGVEILTVTDEPENGILRAQVRVETPDDALELATIEDVQFIEELGDITLNNGTTQWVLQTNTNNSRTIWDAGLRGEGQVIGHIDGVIDMANCFFNDPNVANPGPTHRKVVGLRNAKGDPQDDHGTFSAANAAGEDFNNDALSANPNANNGQAPRARLTHGNLLDLDWITGGTVSFYAYLAAAASDGAFIHTNSWDDKSTSAYTQLSVDLDKFTWDQEDHLVIIGPDNFGTIRPPDSAKNALVVNATLQQPDQGDFSTGITQFSLDGRRKPDLMAPGANITSADGGTNCATKSNGGTSFAAPAVAGHAALVRQYYTEGWYPSGTREPSHAFTPSGALLKATLLNGTVDAAGIAGYPDTTASGEGWGRLLTENALFFDGDARNTRVWDYRHVDGLETGETIDLPLQVATNGEPLKITLVWTEPPGAVNSAAPVVNNLDLTVISPDGTQTFRGNVFNNGVSATGGAADALNNVEMVLVNQPAVGEWTIRVAGTAVNQGKPGQGYAVVASADLTDPPAPVGDQNLLVVRANFSDVAVTPPLPNLQNIMTDVVSYYDEVSLGEVELLPEYRGPISLDHPRNYYYHPTRSLLVELTQEVVDKLIAADADVFDKGTAATADDIDRIVIVTNDPAFNEDRATTGPWPYDMPAGLPRPLSVSVHSYQNSVAQYTHGLGHQFGFVDLYAYPGVVFPRAYVDQWDNMGGFYNNVHVLAWQKEKADWLTEHGATVTYIPRPAGGSTTNNNNLQLFLTSETGTNRKAIAIGLSEGAATIGDEDAFYMIEARDNTNMDFDAALPASGVLVYYVNEQVPQGEGPVIIRDATPATATLDDATFGVGDSTTIPGTGITVTVNAGTGGAAYNINISYAAPATDYNVNITRGDTINGQFYSYFSPDIWIDSPKNGFNLSAGPPAHANRENPVIGEVNRIYARIRNDGPASAFGFDVKWRISEPYHTVGGEADFDTFLGIKHVNQITSGGQSIQYVEWTPVDDGDPHSCVRVDLTNLVGTDTNEYDNWAQENLRKVQSVTASPFTRVSQRYGLRNPYDVDTLFYFRQSGIPADWDVQLVPEKAMLRPGERVELLVSIKPPDKSKICTDERATIESWAARDHTLIPVGGGVLQVDLRAKTAIDIDTGITRCDDGDFERMLEQILQQAKDKGEDVDIDQVAAELEKRFRECRRIVARGCTNPPLPNQEVIVRYDPPVGDPVYRTVKTDGNGCYEDFYLSVD